MRAVGANTVTSAQVADAEIQLVGKGLLADTQRPGIIFRVLDWLIGVQTAPEGHLSPVGNLGWWPRDGARAQFDQQPIEAATLLHAAAAAYETTGGGRYREAVELCYGWFLGANDTGARVADPERGACHDGLTPRGVNENQGAESTLAWLAALAAIRRLRGVAGGASSVAGGVAAVSSR